MLTWPAELLPLIGEFEPLFSKPVWERAKVLLVGAILAPGTRTVTACLRVMGLSQEKRFVNYHRVLNRARWSLLAASQTLLRLLVTRLAPEGEIQARTAQRCINVLDGGIYETYHLDPSHQLEHQVEADECYQSAGSKGLARDVARHDRAPRPRGLHLRGRATAEMGRPPLLGLVQRRDKTDHDHRTVNHGAGAYARRDPDGTCVHCHTMEGMWSGLRHFLDHFKGISQRFLHLRVARSEFLHNHGHLHWRQAFEAALRCLFSTTGDYWRRMAYQHRRMPLTLCYRWAVLILLAPWANRPWAAGLCC